MLLISVKCAEMRLILKSLLMLVGWCSVVGIATGYGLDGLGI